MIAAANAAFYDPYLGQQSGYLPRYYLIRWGMEPSLRELNLHYEIIYVNDCAK